LLADVNERMPAIPTLFPERFAPPPPGEILKRADAFAADPGSDPASLCAQGWGVVVPVGPRGTALEALIKPLIDYRTNEQRAKYKFYRVAVGQDRLAAAEWVRGVFESDPEQSRPRYVLILGNPSEVSLELQLALAPLAAVGRLAFDDDVHYTAYANKAVAAESRSRKQIRSSLFLCDDGSGANNIAKHQLFEPCRTSLAELARERGFRLSTQATAALGKAQLLDTARAADFLFTISHGAGGDMSHADRKRVQGALLSAPGELLTGDDVSTGPFIPDGIWMLFACYGAGTPQTSSYRAWIDDLYQFKALSDRDRRIIDKGQLAAGEEAFIAELPKRALANPEGPLAVIGHIDLAWSYGFTYEGQSRFSRFFGMVKVLMQQHLAGFAMEQIVKNCVIASDQLAQMYLQRREHERGLVPPVNPSLLARTWMLRQDLRNFVLLGDPAVRLRINSIGDAG
jgi:hypothetical protein